MVVAKGNRRSPDVPNDNIPLEKLAQHYEAFNKSEAKSPRTVEWYSRVIGYFTAYLKAQGRSTQLGDIDVHVVREFILYLQNRTRWADHPWKPHPQGNLAPMSIQNYVRGLRAFFAWLHREGYTEVHLLADLRPPRVPQKLTEVLTEDEIRRILACFDPDTPTGCRERAIVVLLLDSGLRLSELTNLSLADTYIEQGYLKVMGKGSKERIVPVGVMTQKLLMRYVYRHRASPARADQDNLFLTLQGRPMTGNAVRLLFSRLARKARVERLHAHLCRHTFATNYLVNGGDVFTLQQILGHSTLEMVKRYVNLASAHVRAQHRKFSPMDSLNLGTLKSAAAKRG